MCQVFSATPPLPTVSRRTVISFLMGEVEQAYRQHEAKRQSEGSGRTTGSFDDDIKLDVSGAVGGLTPPPSPPKS